MTENTDVDIYIVKTPDERFLFAIEIKTSVGKIGIKSEEEFYSPAEAEKKSREVLSEYSTTFKLGGTLSYSYH